MPRPAELSCPLDASCADPVRVLVEGDKIIWHPNTHKDRAGRGCGRLFHGTEDWRMDTLIFLEVE